MDDGVDDGEDDGEDDIVLVVITGVRPLLYGCCPQVFLLNLDKSHCSIVQHSNANAPFQPYIPSPFHRSTI